MEKISKLELKRKPARPQWLGAERLSLHVLWGGGPWCSICGKPAVGGVWNIDLLPGVVPLCGEHERYKTDPVGLFGALAAKDPLLERALGDAFRMIYQVHGPTGATETP